MTSIYNFLKESILKTGSVAHPSGVPELMQVLAKLNQQNPDLAYNILDKCGVGIASTTDEGGRGLLHHMCLLQAQQHRPLYELTPMSTMFDIRMYSDEEGNCYDESGKLMTDMGDNYVFTCVSWLLSKGADVNAMDNLGNTPLIDAIQFITDQDDCFKMCLLLLQSGADPNKVGRFALPTLLTATILNKPRIVHLLLQYGADQNYETANTRLFLKTKESALSYACRNGMHTIVGILLKTKGYKIGMLFNAIVEGDAISKEMIANSLEFNEFIPTSQSGTPKPSAASKNNK